MTNFLPPQEDIPLVRLGERLPGMPIDKEDYPEDDKYLCEVLSSQFGNLYFNPVDQYRDGATRWTTNHGEVCVTAANDTGEVLDIDERYILKARKDNSTWPIYEMGIDAFNELLREAAREQDKEL